MKNNVSTWASHLNVRTKIYFYGSRLEGTNKTESDIDLALEFLDHGFNKTLAWFDYHEKWQSELSKAIGTPVHLELYDKENESVREYVDRKSVVIFEAPKRKTD